MKNEPGNGRIYVTWPWLLSFMGSTILVIGAFGGFVLAGRDDNLEILRREYDHRIDDIESRLGRLSDEILEIVKKAK